MTAMTLDTMFGPQRQLNQRQLNQRQLNQRQLNQRQLNQRPSVRLTRRGRLVVLAAALLVAFAIGVFVTAAGSVATQHPGTPEPTRILQVSSGETLWDISAQLADGGDVRAMMEKIERLNALDSSVLQVGQRLVVPAE